jgi:hypothetical protein
MDSKDLSSFIEQFLGRWKDLSLSFANILEANGIFGSLLARLNCSQSDKTLRNFSKRFTTRCFSKAMLFRRMSARITLLKRYEMLRWKGSITWELSARRNSKTSKSISAVGTPQHR